MGKPRANWYTVDMAAWFTAYNLPKPDAEVRFHPTRRWKFDYAWPEFKVAFEVEGGQWTRGRHQRPLGFQKDCIKYSWAAILGWCVVRATTDMIRSGEASVLIAEALAARQRVTASSHVGSTQHSL